MNKIKQIIAEKEKKIDESMEFTRFSLINNLSGFKEGLKIAQDEVKKFCDEILQPLTNLAVKVERKNYFKFVSNKEKELLKNLEVGE